MAPSATMITPITSAFAGSLGIVYAGLQLRVGLYRVSSKVMYGAEKKGVVDDHLQQISRAGQNFYEYAPYGIFLLYLLESQKLMPEWALCTYGSILAASRLAHAAVLSKPDLPHAGAIRPASFLLTLGAIVSASGYLFYKAYVH